MAKFKIEIELEIAFNDTNIQEWYNRRFQYYRGLHHSEEKAEKLLRDYPYSHEVMSEIDDFIGNMEGLENYNMVWKISDEEK